MEYKKYYYFLLVLCLYFLPAAIMAQASAKENPAGFKLFFEKVYLHTDRSYYASSEHIWYKAYLVNAQSNYPTGSSNNLYVELINADAIIVNRQVIRLDGGIGIGDFLLQDSIAGGTYRIRAYTNWMRNFGDKFIFEKEIFIHNIPGISKNENTMAIKAERASRKVSGVAAYDIQFLPEGGTLVAGINSLVAFKAQDANGNGIEAKGSIITSKNETVARFATAHLGMGSFMFMPKHGIEYHSVVLYANGFSNTADFAAVYDDGITMNITDTANDDFFIKIVASKEAASMTQNKLLSVVVRHAGKAYYKENVVLKNDEAIVTVSKGIFPEGIAAVTLYNASNAQCERLVYIDKNEPLLIIVATDKIVYNDREKVTVKISIGENNQPVKAHLSLCVQDAGLVPVPTANIYTYLNLESELKGRIEDPFQYFDKANAMRKQHLNLLLLTQGWRSFLWQRVASDNINIAYLPEPGITVSGNVKTGFTGKPLANMNITLFATGAKGDKLYMAKTDATGKFFLDGLSLYGNQSIRINSKDDKGKKGGVITIDTLFSSQLPVKAPPFLITEIAGAAKKFAAEARNRWGITKANLLVGSLLPEVIVTGKLNQTEVLFDGIATGFGYPEYNKLISAKDYYYETLSNYLVHNIPGAQADAESDGIYFLAEGKQVRPRFRVDKTQDTYERMDYYNLTMDQIIKVNVRHLIGQTNMSVDEEALMTRVNPGSHIFVISLTLKPNALNNDLSLINTDIDGYFEPRVFYKPNYAQPVNVGSKDVRTTIHWEPFITTNAEGKATVTYYNADPKTKVRIAIEGLSDKGLPFAAVAGYEVK